jgi:alpha-ketoglutarate-dependent taurine dioxygenase
LQGRDELAVNAPSVRALQGDFGVEVRGLDLGVPAPATTRLVEDLLLAHRVVVVRDQTLDDAAQMHFAATLGTLVAAPGGASRRCQPEMRYEVEGPGCEAQAHTVYNSQWHADLSWCRQGARTVTLLYAVEGNPGAAPTAFADMIRAYDALDTTTRSTIESWVAFHHVQRSREVRHGAPSTARPSSAQQKPLRRRIRSIARRALLELRDIADLRASGLPAQAPEIVPPPGAPHRVVQVDPTSGRRFVHLGDHAWTLTGVDEHVGIALVDDLNRRIVTGENRQRHHWARGDLVLFDNRSVLHRREPATDPSVRRVLRRCVVWQP